MAYTGVLLSDDDEIVRYEPNMDKHWPRKDRHGQPKRDWSVQHHLAAEEIQRRFRGRRTTGEPFQLGRLSQRSQDELKPVATFLALHYLFIAADSQGDADKFYARKANHYLERANAVFDEVAIAIDYDVDNSGTTDTNEEQQPMPIRFLRG
jgi:hypothetical protein